MHEFKQSHELEFYTCLKRRTEFEIYEAKEVVKLGNVGLNN